MAIHRKLKKSYLEAIASVAGYASSTSLSSLTSSNGTISVLNADGTRTVIGSGAGTDETGGSVGVDYYVGDTTPPSAPTGVQWVTGNGCITGIWGGELEEGMPADFDRVAFRIGGEEFGEVNVAGSASSETLEDGQIYYCDAVAYDVQGNVSEACEETGVTCEDALVRTTALEQTDEEIKAAATAAYEAATTASETATAAAETAAAASETATAAYEAASEVTITAESILEEVSENYVTSDYLESNYSTREQTSTEITDAITSELYDDGGETIYASTTLIRESGEGVEVARLIDGEYTASKALVDETGFYIQTPGGENMAEFTADEVRLGLSTEDSTTSYARVTLCDDAALLQGSSATGVSLSGIADDDNDLCVITMGLGYWNASHTGWEARDSPYINVAYYPTLSPSAQVEIAGGSVEATAYESDVALTAEDDVTLTAGDDVSISADDAVYIDADGTLTLNSGGRMRLDCESYTDIVASGNIALFSDSSLRLNRGATVHIGTPIQIWDSNSDSGYTYQISGSDSSDPGGIVIQHTGGTANYLTYNSGLSISFTKATFVGFLGNSKKHIYFDIPLACTLGETSASFTALTVQVRQNGSYIVGSSSGGEDVTDYATIYCSTSNAFFASRLECRIKFDSALDATNSDVVAIYCNSCIVEFG